MSLSSALSSSRAGIVERKVNCPAGSVARSRAVAGRFDVSSGGSNSLSRVRGCAGMRESTSRNQANASMPDRLQEAMKLRNAAAVAAHRRPGRTFRQHLRLQLQHILVELADQPPRYPLAQCQPLLRRKPQRPGALLHCIQECDQVQRRSYVGLVGALLRCIGAPFSNPQNPRKLLVRMIGLEPTLPRGNRNLNPARLPISPHPRVFA